MSKKSLFLAIFLVIFGFSLSLASTSRAEVLILAKDVKDWLKTEKIVNKPIGEGLLEVHKFVDTDKTCYLAIYVFRGSANQTISCVK